MSWREDVEYALERLLEVDRGHAGGGLVGLPPGGGSGHALEVGQEVVETAADGLGVVVGVGGVEDVVQRELGHEKALLRDQVRLT